MAEHIIGNTITPRNKKNYIKDSEIDCPSCDKETLHIKSDIDDTVQLECPNCLYVENRPSDHFKEMTDIRGRPIKAPEKR